MANYPGLSVRESGQALTELAVIVPILIAIALVIVDFGWASRNHIVLVNSGREAARVAVSCLTDEEIKAFAADHSSGLLTPDDVTVLANPCKTGGLSGDPIEIKVEYLYHYITPLGGVLNILSGGSIPNPLPLSSTTSMKSE